MVGFLIILEKKKHEKVTLKNNIVLINELHINCYLQKGTFLEGKFSRASFRELLTR